MTTPDPIALLEALALKVVQRQRVYPDEVWIFVGLLARIATSRRDWLDALPEADRQLFYEALDAPLRAYQDARVH